MIRLGSVNSSENTSDKMNEHHEKVEELFQNQKYILEAVANLNERLAKLEEKIDNQNVDEVKEILDSQAIIDEIIVKNSDDILQIQKVKEENADMLKSLKDRIDILDDEAKEIIREKKEINRCRYHNRGYCKNKGLCLFFHPTKICPAFLRDGKCLLINCSSRQILEKGNVTLTTIIMKIVLRLNHRLVIIALDLLFRHIFVSFVVVTFAQTAHLEKRMMKTMKRSLI